MRTYDMKAQSGAWYGLTGGMCGTTGGAEACETEAGEQLARLEAGAGADISVVKTSAYSSAIESGSSVSGWRA